MSNSSFGFQGAKRASRKGFSKENRQSTACLVCALILAATGVILYLSPFSSLGWGLDFSDGIRTCYAADSEDEDVLTETAKIIGERLNDLGLRGVRARLDADLNVLVDYPSSLYGATLAEVLSERGYFELVNLDTISDAEAVEKIENGVTGFVLDADSYTAFLGGENISSYQAVPTSYTFTDNTLGYLYGYYLAFNEEGTEILKEETEQLAPVSGSVVFLLDGEVLYSGTVTEAVETGEAVVYLALSESYAAMQALMFNLGYLPVSLSLEETVGAPSAFGTYLPYILAAIAGVFLLFLIILAVVFKGLGLLAFLAAVSDCLFELGLLALFSACGMFEMTLRELVLGCTGAIASLGFFVAVLLQFKKQVAAGQLPRNAARRFVRGFERPYLCVLLALMVVFVLGQLVSNSLSVSSACCIAAVVALASAGAMYLVLTPLVQLFAAASMRKKPAFWGLNLDDPDPDDA